jgi:hypothetical protein
LAIEKYLALYEHLYGLDFRLAAVATIVRVASRAEQKDHGM